MSFYLDNRDMTDVSNFQEARIEALKRRVDELELEKRDQLAERDLEILTLHRVILALRKKLGERQ